MPPLPNPMPPSGPSEDGSDLTVRAPPAPPQAPVLAARPLCVRAHPPSKLLMHIGGGLRPLPHTLTGRLRRPAHESGSNVGEPMWM